jgi:hypothetical protein
MKRFLMLVAVAVVASAMYVAASPASQQSSGSTTKQVRALQKRVAKMSKILKTVKVQAQYARDYVHDCLRTASSGAMPVSEFGDAANHTHGYQYFDGTSTHWTTALDIDTSDSPGAYLQKVDRACANR